MYSLARRVNLFAPKSEAISKCAIYIDGINVRSLRDETQAHKKQRNGMAIEFARVHVISRGAGHSAMKAAAYRAGEHLYDAKLGQTANYEHRNDEVLHSEILLPDGADSRLLDREILWNTVEAREDEHNRRDSAQLAKDHIIALPKELNHEQHIELARDFAKSEFLEKGLVVDLNIHGHSEGNPHAHLMVTTRALDGDRFGLKCRELNGGFYGGRKVPDAEMLKVRWADFQEAYFAKNELDVGVVRNNGEYPSELHLGPVHGMEKDGKASVKKVENDRRIEAREAAILSDPSIIIERVAIRKSVFSRHDLYREMSNVVRNPEVFAAVKAKLDVHDSLIRLNPKTPGKAVFTTQAVIDTEMMIRGQGEQLSRSNNAFSRIDVESVLGENSFLSEEQRNAVREVCSDTRLASVIGLAGAGKSTMLGTARAVFEENGHAVRGIALAGKAAEELEKASGIASSTIHSWLYRVEDGRELLKRGDVVVMDEAGMVDNALMSRVITQVNQSGAKLVMVGDPEQLQPIQAGRPFRDLSQRHGTGEISTIRRQQQAWQREATLKLARGQGYEAVREYAKRGCVPAEDTQAQAIERLVDDYLADVTGQGGGESGQPDARQSHAVLAHSNKAVDAMNAQIRAGLTDLGLLGESQTFTLKEKDSEKSVISRSMEIGIGERVLFTKNSTMIGVKNGTLGEVVGIKGNQLQVKTDGSDTVSFSLADYAHIRHGYAMTIHKSQGITVDRTSVLATPSLNKHLLYVAMSRHRENHTLYYGRDDFASLDLLADRATQVERAESVADFAARHGVDLETGQRTDMVPEVEEKPVVEASTGEAAVSVEEAQEILDSTRLSLIESMKNAAEQEIKTAERAALLAKRAVDDHRTDEPRQGFLASKVKHEEWLEKLESLTRLTRHAQRNVSTLKEALEFSQEKFSREARRVALRQHPEAATVVKTHQAQARAAELILQIEEIQRDIAELSDGSQSATRRDPLYMRLDRAIKNLSGDEVAKSVLTPVQVKAVAEASRQLAHGKQGRQVNERNRGGHEL